MPRSADTARLALAARRAKTQRSAARASKQAAKTRTPWGDANARSGRDDRHAGERFEAWAALRRAQWAREAAAWAGQERAA